MSLLIALTSVVITRDAHTILPRDLPEHEVPVVQAIFGEDNVELKGRVEGQSVELDAENEADRLLQKYGDGAVQAAFGVNFKTAISKALKDAAIEGAGAPSELDELTKPQLLALAAEKGVKVDAASTKAKIIEAIEGAGA